MMWHILGPVEIVTRGRTLDVGRPQLRAVLAYLLLNADMVVGVDHLVAALWGNAPPEAARRQVRVRVSQLRSALRGAGLTQVPATVAGGYRLAVDDGELDAAVFAAHVKRARAASAQGQVAGAAEHLRRGLELWRGPALAGAAGAFVEAAAARLHEQRLDAYEQLADAELALGRHGALVGLLRPVVDAHPLRERLVGQLMLALAGSGRQADALALFGQTRARLADELGVAPSAQLTGAQVRVLRQQISRPGGPPRPSPDRAAHARSAASIAPAQLPADIACFAGRVDELRELDELLARGNGVAGAAGGTGAGGGAPTRICVIDGTAGVGKTTLAVRWAHQIADRFPDGQFHVNLRGFDPGGRIVAPGEALRGFLDALGVPADRIPGSLAEQAALWRSLLAGRRVLVVLDNARATDQVRPLLPGTPGSLVLVTSRSQLAGLVAVEGAHPMTLDLPSQAEARTLLARRLGPFRVAAESDAIDEIIVRCARLPLALAIVAARAATSPTFPVATFAAQLRDTTGELDAFDIGEPNTDIRAVFSWSYRTLDPAAARVFRLLSLHPGPDAAMPAVASLAGATLAAARDLLARLIRAHLLVEPAAGRFTWHDLLRAYASEMCRQVDSDAERMQARHRLYDHYLHTAHAADRLLHPLRGDPVSLRSPQAGVVLADVPDRDRASDWLTTEHTVLLAIADTAARTGFEAHSGELAHALSIVLDYRGRWRDLVTIHGTALTAARRVADRPGQARAHRCLASAQLRLGRGKQAMIHLRSALALYTDLGDQAGQAQVHLRAALAFLQEGRVRESLARARQALEVYRHLGDRLGEADALNNIGWCHAQLGDADEAVACCQRSVDLHVAIGDEHGQANAWDSLGYAHHRRGDDQRAIECYRRALNLFADTGDRRHEAMSFDHLGDAHTSAGDPEAAQTVWRRAVDILAELDHPDAEVVRGKLTPGRVAEW